jgi:hypothetical protein
MFSNSSYITVNGGSFTYIQSNSSQIVIANGAAIPARPPLSIEEAAQCTSIEPPASLQRIQLAFRLLRNLVDPSHRRSFRKVYFDLLMVQKLVGVAWEACCAFASTEIGPLVWRSLEGTFSHCETVLEEVHKALALHLNCDANRKTVTRTLPTIPSVWAWDLEAQSMLSSRLALATLVDSLLEELWSLR